MVQSGTSEVEQPIEGDLGADGEGVQFDLFGMPVDAATAKGDGGAKLSHGTGGPAGAVETTRDAGVATATGTAGANANAAQQTGGRATSCGDATAAPGSAIQPERRRQSRAKTAGISSLWEDGQEEAHGPDEASASPEANAIPADTSKKRRTREILAAPPSPELLALAAQLPPQIHLGTSTWSFPGWNGIVYGDEYSNSKLSREGLTAYGAHPLLKTVSIDRSFYQPLTVTEYLRYAQQVPEDFRFIVKAPMTITDATVRAERGEPVSMNPCFLNAQMAIDDFVTPCLEGLGVKAGALVFQLSPLPDQMLAQPAVFIERLAEFLMALPKLPESACYAIEIRDGSLLTPRFIRTLKTAGVRYCVGIHARMPDPLRQAAALALLDGDPAGPLIVRWSLHGGFKYEQAKAKYEPFNQLVDQDPATRASLAELAARYALAGQPVVIAINNKAEGSAPLSCVELARAIIEAYARLAHEHGHEDESPPSEEHEPRPSDENQPPSSDENEQPPDSDA